MFLSSCQSFFFSPCGRGWGPHAKTAWVRASACFADGRGADQKNTYGHGLAEKIQLRRGAAVYFVYTSHPAAVYFVYNHCKQRLQSLSTAFTITVNSGYNHCQQRLQSAASSCLQSLQSAKGDSSAAVYKVYNQQKETARQLSTKFTISRKRQLGSCLQSLQSAAKRCKLSLQGA